VYPSDTIKNREFYFNIYMINLYTYPGAINHQDTLAQL